MSDQEYKRFSALHFLIGLVLSAVCLWDIYALKVSDWQFYYPFKITIISAFFFVSYLLHKKKIEPSSSLDVSMVVFYIYSYIGITYLHSTYIFSFYEGFVFFCFIYGGSPIRYGLICLFGLSLTLLGLRSLPEPEFIREGHSIIPHLQTLSVILAILSYVIYHFFQHQKALIRKMDQKFASIGRQSAFLLHELKSPLSRFMMSNSEKDNRDAEYILSIVEGVELLITRVENLSFSNFSWKDIKIYLEDEFGPVCDIYKIKFDITGFEGEGFGHRSTIKLALKNLIKNAVEAIAMEGTEGTIKIRRLDGIIEVSNNGSIITNEKIEKLFTPFYSEKNTKNNHGIGLHFVESVVKAHNGSIGVKVEDGWNVFRIKLGKI